jgi:ribonuclease-3
MDRVDTEPCVAAEECLAPLQESLGYRFREPALLALALSALKQPLTPAVAAARQRLEFLGDAAWNFAVALAVFRSHRQAAPGDLTRVRSAWSSRAGLARLARRLGLPIPSLAPHGPSQRVLAELLEAVLGAVVEDGGFEAVCALAVRVTAPAAGIAPLPVVDAKSSLQMYTLAAQGKLPSYRLIERRGPSHQPTFRVALTVQGPQGEVRVEAEGGNRQAAEQHAARLALELLGKPQESGHNIS